MSGLSWKALPRAALLTLAVIAMAAAGSASAASLGEQAIPYQSFMLGNGLTLIVHEDRSAPLVAVNVWYHVGSKDEAPGRTGFAHLFEHLMYQGSEHYRGEYFEPFERIGATRMNGTTDNDRTNYFQTVPTGALDLALWMESDRMAHLLGAIDQATLDEQRAVVKNEKRQRENQPYGSVWEHIARLSFPEGHPYRWPVIGAMEDLDAASLEDVKAWFRQHYGAANAVLVVAGDVAAEEVLARVRHYFGAAPPGPALLHQRRWIPRPDGVRRATLEDDVPQARLYLVWNTPAWGESEADRLDLLAGVLAGNPSALLDRELVQQRELATRIRAFQYSRELAGQFWITADAAPGASLPELETAILETLQELIGKKLPTATLATAKTQYRADFLRGIEELGGFGGRADVLAAGAIYNGDPGAYQRTLEVIGSTDSATAGRTLQRWLGPDYLSLQVVPQPAFQRGMEAADRTRLPDVAVPEDFKLPEIQRDQLANGLQLVLLQRSGLPLVELALQLPAGHARSADQPGLAAFAAQLLTEGENAAGISARLRQQGARFNAEVNLDTAELQLQTLGEHLGESARLLAEIALRPALSDRVLQRVRQQHLAAIERERSDPDGLASRLLPTLLLPASHPYAQPLSGLGRPAVIEHLDRKQVEAFYRRHYIPSGSALIAVGDLDMPTLRKLAERYFDAWPSLSSQATDPLPAATAESGAAAGARLAGATVYLVDRPGATQATVRAARLLSGDYSDNEWMDRAALNVANGVFGGTFSARLNLNLREDKGWSYGAYSRLHRHAGADWLTLSTSVQSDHAAAALTEINSEWQRFTAAAPVTEAERERIVAQLIRSRSGGLATLGALRNELAEHLRLGLPDRELDEYDDRLRAVDLSRVREVAAAALGTHPHVWLVIGDRSQLQPQLQSMPWVARIVDAVE